MSNHGSIWIWRMEWSRWLEKGHSTKYGGLALWDSMVGAGYSLNTEVRPKSFLCRLLVLWFWPSCQLHQPQFPRPQILIVMLTSLANGKVKRQLSIAPTSPKFHEHQLVFLEQQWHGTWPTGTGRGMYAPPRAKALLGRHHSFLCYLSWYWTRASVSSLPF